VLLTYVLYNIRMLKFLQKVDFLLELLFLFLFEVADFDLLDCNKLSSGEIEALEDLPTCTTADNFTNLLYIMS
jgi:hypothetical protein